MLSTVNEYSKIFTNTKRIMLDSCVLIESAKNERIENLILAAEREYTIVIPTISLLEVGFGPRACAGQKQIDIATDIYAQHIKIDTTSIDAQDNLESRGKRFIFNPTHHEYFAARTALIGLMEMHSEGGRWASKLQMDALIYYSCWNSRCSLITENTKDFELINKYQVARNAKWILPIFNLEQLNRSLSENIEYNREA